MPNGKKGYNVFVSTDGDGADTTPYTLYRRNWESDFLTSALPSPQQGVAPLAGLTALGTIQVEDNNGNVTTATYETDDSDRFTGRVSIHNPGESVSNDIRISRDAMAKVGLSINDFRNVNALQRWLEVNMRKGMRYYDHIAGHFGDGPSRTELDMPIYLGGFNEDINVTSITQTSAGTADNPLGSYAGQANAFGGSKHSVNHYCDDYGYIMGIICIVPDPSYSQILPKYFLESSPLDYYYPEFSQLGMQPITYKEVAPLQSSLEGKSLTDTFGYQRPNYDMVQNIDTCHGQFRTSLHNLVIGRLFSSRPELGNDFLTIDPYEVNQIFAIQSPDADNFIGQIIIDMKMKRPVPRISIPSLGR